MWKITTAVEIWDMNLSELNLLKDRSDKSLKTLTVVKKN